MREVKNIIWDFDGVILLTEKIRIKGFEEIFSDYPRYQVEKLLSYHAENGGLSRYKKIRYFHEEILQKDITIDEINLYAKRFSEIMLKDLIDTSLLNPDWINFIHANFENYEHHIASGSDEEELKYVCEALGIHHYFRSINGSPMNKNQIVKNLKRELNASREDTVLVGDSINDHEAAQLNDITFFGYNNDRLDKPGMNYLHDLCQINK